MNSVARIRINSGGLFLWTGSKFVSATPDEVGRVLYNVTKGYPAELSKQDRRETLLH